MLALSIPDQPIKEALIATYMVGENRFTMQSIPYEPKPKLKEKSTLSFMSSSIPKPEIKIEEQLTKIESKVSYSESLDQYSSESYSNDPKEALLHSSPSQDQNKTVLDFFSRYIGVALIVLVINRE